MVIVDTNFVINTLRMHEENCIKVANVSNISTSSTVNIRGQAGGRGSPRVSDLEKKMRQVSINGDREWLTAIKCLIENMNTRVCESVIIIAITARAIVSAIVRGDIVPAIIRRAIASAIIVGIIAMPAIVVGIIATMAIIGTFTDRTKRSLNLA